MKGNRSVKPSTTRKRTVTKSTTRAIPTNASTSALRVAHMSNISTIASSMPKRAVNVTAQNSHATIQLGSNATPTSVAKRNFFVKPSQTADLPQMLNRPKTFGVGVKSTPIVIQTTAPAITNTKRSISFSKIPSTTIRPSTVQPQRIKPVINHSASYTTHIKPSIPQPVFENPFKMLSPTAQLPTFKTKQDMFSGLTSVPIYNPIRGLKVSADRLRKGNLIEFGDDKKKVRIESITAAMMGRRPTSLQMELRDPQSGKTYPARFMPGDSVELVELEAQTLTFLYCEGEVGYVMHPETFEQFEFEASVFGPARNWIPADTNLQCFFENGTIFSLNLPDNVIATVQSVPLNPVVTIHSGNEFKEVTCSNGEKIKVPMFVEEGDQIRVKLEDISFMGRANN